MKNLLLLSLLSLFAISCATTDSKAKDFGQRFDNHKLDHFDTREK